jgi:hypothetical protein
LNKTLSLKSPISIEQATYLTNTVGVWFNGLQVEQDTFGDIVSSYILITYEHQKSILSLIQLNLISSAAALIRPLYEASVTGTWLSLKNNRQMAKKIITNDYHRIKVNQMHEEIESHNGDHIFIKKSDLNMKALHNYTHGGLHLISRCINGGNVIPKFPENEISEILSITTISMLGLIHAYALNTENTFLLSDVEAELYTIAEYR